MNLAEIIKESFSLKEAEQKDDIVLNSIEEWDSMSHMLFITRVEENYEIEFTGNDILSMQTIGDIKNVLIANGKTV